MENTKQFDGLYVPPFLKKGTFVFFAVDNTHFSEDTVDGKGTTHGTIPTLFQKADVPGEAITANLEVSEAKKTYRLSLIMYPLKLAANQNLAQ